MTMVHTPDTQFTNHARTQFDDMNNVIKVCVHILIYILEYDRILILRSNDQLWTRAQWTNTCAPV